MSLEQLRTYLQTDEAKKDLVEKAREAGYEVVEEDLECVTGGLSAQDINSDSTGRRSAKDQDGARFEKPCDENHNWKGPDNGKPWAWGSKD